MNSIKPNSHLKRKLFYGYDPASKVDRSAFVCFEQMEDGCLYLRMAINLRGVGYIEQCQEIINICRLRGITNLAVDGTNNSQVVETLSRAFPGKVLNVYFTRQIKEQMMTDLRIAFQSREIKLARNFKYYRLICKELNELDPKKLDHPKNGSSDFAWSVALAKHASLFIRRPMRMKYMKFFER